MSKTIEYRPIGSGDLFHDADLCMKRGSVGTKRGMVEKHALRYV